MIEALAQLGGFLIELSTNRPGAPLRRALLSQIDRARFSRPAWVGDRLDLVVTYAASLDVAARLDAEATVDGATVARATLTFMLREVDAEAVHAQRRALYKVWTRTLDPRPEIL